MNSVNHSPGSPFIINQVTTGCPLIGYNILHKGSCNSPWKSAPRGRRGKYEPINNLFPKRKLWFIMLLQGTRMLVFRPMAVMLQATNEHRGLKSGWYWLLKPLLCLRKNSLSESNFIFLDPSDWKVTVSQTQSIWFFELKIPNNFPLKVCSIFHVRPLQANLGYVVLSLIKWVCYLEFLF